MYPAHGVCTNNMNPYSCACSAGGYIPPAYRRTPLKRGRAGAVSAILTGFIGWSIFEEIRGDGMAVEKLLITFLTEGWKRGGNRAENTPLKSLS